MRRRGRTGITLRILGGVGEMIDGPGEEPTDGGDSLSIGAPNAALGARLRGTDVGVTNTGWRCSPVVPIYEALGGVTSPGLGGDVTREANRVAPRPMGGERTLICC